MKFTNKKNSQLIWLAIIITIVAYAIWDLRKDKNVFLLIDGIGILIAIVVISFSPHFFLKRINPERWMPTIFFSVGIILMVVGCLSSLYFSNNMKNFKIIGYIGEIWPLILGAALGGNYCSDAILGQKFNKVLQKVKPLYALPAIIIFVILPLLYATNKIDVTTIGWALFVGFSPLIALFILNSTKSNSNEWDSAFVMLVVGFFMIVITILGTHHLLSEIYVTPEIGKSYTPTDSFNFVKNFIPVYSGSIGAGLILKSIAENNVPFELEKWTKEYFKQAKFDHIDNELLIFTRILENSGQVQTIKVKTSKSVITDLENNAFRRHEYGNAAEKWFNEELRKTAQMNNKELTFRMPKKDNLLN